MQYLSVCSGIDAATQAFAPLGWKPVAFSEIEPFPRAVLAHHYPDVPNWGDMTRFKEWPDAAVDLLCGGTPCQSFSVAGLRQGLADPRGNLMLTFGAIAKRYRPRFVLWENVPGVLSSGGGRDFGAFLGMLVELGYGVAYRVLDAQFVRTRSFPFAIPQRRRRVFVVGYLGDWRRAAAILFDRESLSGHPPPGRKAGQEASHDVAGSLVSSGRGVGRTGETRGQDPVIAMQANSGDVGYCLTASAQQSLDAETETLIAAPVACDVADSLTVGANQTWGRPGGEPVAHSLRGDGFDAGEDGTGRGTPLVPIAFSSKDFGADAGPTAPTLRAMGHAGSHANAGGQVAIAIQERAVSENPAAGPDGAGFRQDGAAYTHEARILPQAVAFDLRGRDGGRNVEIGGDVAFALTAPNGGGRAQERMIALPWAVRRLTPVECERLMGFPDNFTAIPYRGKPAEKCPDGPRYKALGNSWAVNCAEWIGERIAEVDSWSDET